MKSLIGMIVAGILGFSMAAAAAVGVVSVQQASEETPVKKPLVVYGER